MNGELNGMDYIEDSGDELITSYKWRFPKPWGYPQNGLREKLIKMDNSEVSPMYGTPQMGNGMGESSVIFGFPLPLFEYQRVHPKTRGTNRLEKEVNIQCLLSCGCNRNPVNWDDFKMSICGLFSPIFLRGIPSSTTRTYHWVEPYP